DADGGARGFRLGRRRARAEPAGGRVAPGGAGAPGSAGARRRRADDSVSGDLMSELCWASMADLGRMIATKQVSPVEVVRAHLDRIAAHDGKLRAFITVCADAALESARAAEAELMAGRPVGPLRGGPRARTHIASTSGARR